MHALTILCSYPGDDEVTQVSYQFGTLADAKQALDAVCERIQDGGLFQLPSSDGFGPIPFHAETVTALFLSLRAKP